MSLIITNGGKTQALSYLVGKDTTVQNLSLKLFSNNVTPSSTTTTDQFVEVSASSTGYSAITLSGSSWNVDETSAIYPQQTWTFTSPVGNVYGYYVTTQDGTTILAERFSDGPYNVATTGDIIRVTLNLLIV